MLQQDHLVLRYPTPKDGAQLFDLIKNCPPLDTNSMYCNLLHCSHFASTSIAAEVNSSLVGFISAYLKPSDPNTLFIWQVAVAEQARGQGLAEKMLEALLARPECRAVSFLETTITPDNHASWRLFTKLANKQQASMHKEIMFDEQQHFAGQHQSEYLLQIGPLQAQHIYSTEQAIKEIKL